MKQILIRIHTLNLIYIEVNVKYYNKSNKMYLSKWFQKQISSQDQKLAHNFTFSKLFGILHIFFTNKVYISV